MGNKKIKKVVGYLIISIIVLSMIYAQHIAYSAPIIYIIGAYILAFIICAIIYFAVTLIQND